jgi:hypothetical protein
MERHVQQLNVFNEQFMQQLIYIGIKFLFLLNIIKTYSEINYLKLYNNNEFFHKCTDSLCDNAYYIKRLTMNCYIEAPFSYFMVCYKEQNYKEACFNLDSIIYNNTNGSPILTDLHLTYHKIFSIIKPIANTNELEYLLVFHFRNLKFDYIVTRLMCSEEKCYMYCQAEPTLNFFLSIEYEHPSMENTISLVLDKRYLIAGNELFSPCFVLKCLNYQNEPFIFDTDYTLTILDSDIKTITLSNKNYIRLNNSNYEVMKLSLCNKKTD